jgi:hypothetical protein
VCGDAIDVAPDETNGSARVLVASWRERDAVQVWDVRGGMVTVDVPFGAVSGRKKCTPYAARWAPEGGVAYVGGSGSCEFRAVDAGTKKTLGRCAFDEGGAVHAIDVSGGLVGVTCADGVRVYEAAR